MSGAHPDERAFFWLIGGLLGATFVSIIVNGLYPATSRRIWIDITGIGMDATAWLFDALPMGWIIGLSIVAIFTLVTIVVLLKGLQMLRRLVT